MSNFDSNETIDHMADNPWATVSGAGTSVSGVLPSWADDYTRFRSGAPTYSSVDDLIGRVKTGRELDKGKY